MAEEKSVVSMLRDTAQNTYALLMQMAVHIEKIETENAELKRKLEVHEDDLK